MNSVLVDTNVLLYSIDKDSKYFDLTNELFSSINFNFYTTSKNISEFLAVITRIPKNKISIKEALSILEDFNKSITFLYPTNQSLSIFTKLVGKYRPEGILIYDYEIVSIALANDIKLIATLNEKDFASIQEIEILKF